MPNTNNLDQEIEEGLAQAEKMLRVEKNMNAISEINIDELPEMALPIYMRLQENISDENWDEVVQLAQALKVLAPKIFAFDQLITQVNNKIEKKKQKKERQEELALQKEKDNLRQVEEDVKAQLADTGHKSISSENAEATKKTPAVMDVAQPKKQSQPKLAWGLAILFGILSFVAGYMYMEANNRADSIYSRYQDAKDTITEQENTLAGQENTIVEQASFLSVQDHIVGFFSSNNVDVISPGFGSLTDENWRYLLDDVDEDNVMALLEHVSFFQDRTDFLLTVKFENPGDIEKLEKIMYGVVFREKDDTYFLLAIKPKQNEWVLISVSDGVDEPVAGGELENFNAEEGGWNSILLATDASKGYLFINGQLQSQMDLSANISEGIVDIFSSCDEKIYYKNLTLWHYREN